MLRFGSLIRNLNARSGDLFPLRCFHVSATGPETQFLETSSLGKTRQIAYQKIDGIRSPGIMYIPGFMSHKAATKATMLHMFCQEYGFPYIRYDPSGLGETKGVKQSETNLTVWLEDAAQVLSNLTDGPQLVVASSMGGWISSILAKRYPEKFSSLLMLAPAINFGRKYMQVLLSQLPPGLVKKFEADEVVKLFVPEYGEFPLRKSMFEDMKQHELSMEAGSIPVQCPTRIIHGVKDKDVPYKESLQVLGALQTNDVQLLYVKHGGHQLSDSASLEIICDTILKMTAPKHKKE
ncbi:palmitoyl-protein thioesterase ABHD10, mitochondrial-like [Penaeus chinensis]|uniref:palmitoyl-protein thioesterase ABHD10, mitochondrial-like n=1 Tax=Penaeus chinensis TaxID=139456 RepID=UPI001FB5F6F9|nr:palmitoyl-protein thioesterase ABHD10, mitochondrial-like [Penaeus chinensis]